jgi:hypothetical protein
MTGQQEFFVEFLEVFVFMSVQKVWDSASHPTDMQKMAILK